MRPIRSLSGGLDELRVGRIERAKRMGDALAAIGIPGVYEGALCFVTNPEPDLARAFRSLSGVDRHRPRHGRGVPALPDAGQARLRRSSLGDAQEAIGWITAAGGVAVVAHPGRYKMSGSANAALSRRLQGCRRAGHRSHLRQPFARSRHAFRPSGATLRLSRLARLRFPRAGRELCRSRQAAATARRPQAGLASGDL